MLFIAQIKKPLPSTAETGQDISITKVPSDKQKSRTNMENLKVYKIGILLANSKDSRIKFQESRLKNQVSRIIKIKIQESREDSIKISTKKCRSKAS